MQKILVQGIFISHDWIFFHFEFSSLIEVDISKRPMYELNLDEFLSNIGQKKSY